MKRLSWRVRKHGFSHDAFYAEERRRKMEAQKLADSGKTGYCTIGVPCLFNPAYQCDNCKWRGK